LVFHYIGKTDLINQCIANNTGDTGEPFVHFHSLSHAKADDDGRPLTNVNIDSYCNSAWNRSTFYESVYGLAFCLANNICSIAWLIALLIFALFSASLAAAFYHQLRNPLFQRTQDGAPSAQYRMNPFGHEAQFAPPPPFAPSGTAGSYPPMSGGGDFKNEPPNYVRSVALHSRRD
jgi:hypothetical protein